MKAIFELIKRLKRKRSCKVHFDKDSLQMKDYKVAFVHDILDDVLDNQEFDFYIATKYDTYLLRMINSKDNSINIYPAKGDGVICIVSKLPFSKNNILEVMDEALNRLRNEKYGFPKLKNPKTAIIFQIC